MTANAAVVLRYKIVFHLFDEIIQNVVLLSCVRE